MNRADFQKLANLRRKEAKALLDSQNYVGGYYLLGYSLECALKAAIAKNVRKHDYPNKRLALECHTHDLDKLLSISGLKLTLDADSRRNPTLIVNWAVVKDWTEASRYELQISKQESLNFYKACTSRSNGVLAWIKKYW